jgi:hypothetical protein
MTSWCAVLLELELDPTELGVQFLEDGHVHVQSRTITIAARGRVRRGCAKCGTREVYERADDEMVTRIIESAKNICVGRVIR